MGSKEGVNKKRITGPVLEKVVGRVRNSRDFETLEAEMASGRASGVCAEPMLPLLLAALYRARPGPYLVLVPGFKWAEELTSDLGLFLEEEVERLTPLDVVEGGPFKTFAEGAGRRHKAARLLRERGVQLLPELAVAWVWSAVFHFQLKAQRLPSSTRGVKESRRLPIRYKFREAGHCL